MVVAVGSKIVLLDVFDQPATCERVWSRLLSGVVFEALATTQAERPPAASDLGQFFACIDTLTWEQTEAVGEGVEYRSEGHRGEHASALYFEQALVHASVVVAAV
jgi:hypothetical protein